MHEIEEGSPRLHCKSLASIDFPSTLRVVGYAAFEGCTSLTHITLPSSLVEIGTSAFNGCINLKEVNINGDKQLMKLSEVFNDCSEQIFNFQSISTRLDNIPAASLSQMEIMCRIDAIRDPLLQRNGSKLFASAEAARVEKEGETIKGSLDKIDRLITYYETIKEGTIVFELALWKAKLEQADHHINRDACRIDVPGPVKDAVMQYLW